MIGKILQCGLHSFLFAYDNPKISTAQLDHDGTTVNSIMQNNSHPIKKQNSFNQIYANTIYNHSVLTMTRKSILSTPVGQPRSCIGTRYTHAIWSRLAKPTKCKEKVLVSIFFSVNAWLGPRLDVSSKSFFFPLLS